MRRIQALREENIPILWVRFEDLVDNPKESLCDLSRFFLNIQDIKGTNAERNVERVISKGKKATQTYDLKEKQQRFNKSRGLYT